MPNAFLTPSKVLNEGLMILENELILGGLISNDYSSEYTTVGNTINIRRPTQYAGQRNNLDITSYVEDIQQATVPVAMDQTFTIAVEVPPLDETFNFDRWSEDVIKPAMVKCKDEVEAHIASLYTGFYHFSGTPNTIPANGLALSTMGARLTDGAVPVSGRVGVHGTDASATLAHNVAGTFIDSKNKTAIEEVKIGRLGGFMNYESAHAPTHTVGVATGTPRVNGGTQATTYALSKQTWSQTLATDGWTNSTNNILRAGDVITLANVFAVNPVSKQSTGRLQTFTVLANANSGASTGPADLTISPPIITSGAYQTVTAQPADDAVITVVTGTGGASYKQSLMFHPAAMTLVTRPLSIPSGMGVRTSTKNGNKVTVSCTEVVDYNTLKHKMRFDMLYKAVLIDSRLGGRLTN